MQTVLGIILGGGAGTRLYPLTKKRAKPAVPLGANYRLIDIPVSNCVNSNVTKIYCLTQFNSASLNRHLSQAYVSASQQQQQQHCGRLQGTVRDVVWQRNQAQLCGLHAAALRLSQALTSTIFIATDQMKALQQPGLSTQ